MRIDIVCGTCGGRNVSRADWDIDAQEWALGAVFDYGHCHDCEGESRLEVVEVADEDEIEGPPLAS